MKHFVINPRGWGLRLKEEHINWLKTHGYTDADLALGKEDRSNPDLIACIQAVRDSKKDVVMRANELHERAKSAVCNAEDARIALSCAINNVLYLLNYRSYHRNAIIAEIRKVLDNDMDWGEARSYAGPKPGVSAATVRKSLDGVYETFVINRPMLDAARIAQEEFHAYCNANNLIANYNGVEFNDGFEIKSYDDTKFTASVIRVSASESHFDEDYEVMKLKPFITRETIAKYVNSGSTDGLIEYLKSLHIDNSLDIRE